MNIQILLKQYFENTLKIHIDTQQDSEPMIQTYINLSRYRYEQGLLQHTIHQLFQSLPWHFSKTKLFVFSMWACWCPNVFFCFLFAAMLFVLPSTAHAKKNWMNHFLTCTWHGQLWKSILNVFQGTCFGQHPFVEHILHEINMPFSLFFSPQRFMNPWPANNPGQHTDEKAPAMCKNHRTHYRSKLLAFFCQQKTCA